MGFSDTLRYFLESKADATFFNDTLYYFSQLDDIDVMSALKSWQSDEDFILSKMCRMLLNRELPHIKMKNSIIPDAKMKEKLQEVMTSYGLEEEDASYFVFGGEVINKAYDDSHQTINILKKSGKVTHLLKESDQLSLKALSKKVTKYYICYPR